MNITFFIGSIYGGGAERVTCNLANAMARKNHRVKILVMSETKEGYPLDDAVKVVPLLKITERKNTIYNALLRIQRFRAHLRANHKTDVYLVMLPITMLMMLWFRKETNARVVVSERADPDKLAGWIRFGLKKLIKRADGIVFQTEDARQWYVPYLGACKSIVIPNALSEEVLSCAEVPWGERRQAVVAAGRLNEQKNFPLLIRSFQSISSKYPEHSLTIYGEGEDRGMLEELIRKLDVPSGYKRVDKNHVISENMMEDRGSKNCSLKEEIAETEKEKGYAPYIHLPGYTNHLAATISDTKVFVLSSDYEGMPNALMEAMALGLCCIATDCPVGGPRELIKDGVNGLLVPVGDQEALAKAFKCVLSDDAFAASLGEQARRIREEYTPEKIYGVWSEFLDDILE